MKSVHKHNQIHSVQFMAFCFKPGRACNFCFKPIVARTNHFKVNIVFAERLASVWLCSNCAKNTNLEQGETLVKSQV